MKCYMCYVFSFSCSKTPNHIIWWFVKWSYLPYQHPCSVRIHLWNSIQLNFYATFLFSFQDTVKCYIWCLFTALIYHMNSNNKDHLCN